MAIKLLIVDDHPLVREGIAARLESEEKFKVVGEASNGQAGLDMARSHQPDVVLMDVSMPIMNGFEACEAFKAQMPEIKVLILTMHEDREYIVRMIKTGASGYVLKDVSSSELMRAIETVFDGGTYFSSGASQALFSEFDNHETTEEPVLTRREEMVLTHLAEGCCNKEIAKNLDISVRTVETHRQNIKQKLNIQSAAGLTRYAIEHDLVKL
ncbi:MAG: response regulator [Pontibacterium sp.]